MLVPATGAQRASRDPRASQRHRGRRLRLALSAMLSAAVLATLGAAPAGAATVSPTSIRGWSAERTVTTSATISKPWYSIEKYYLSLVNCTRTGGWVLRDGTCRGYGSGRYSRYVAPLRYSIGISDRVSRPYARLLAQRGLCTHYADHDPGYRLRRAGFTAWTWGENIGCGTGYATVKAAVLASHLRMQGEKSTNGGHWRNIKSTRYHRVGIGIWKYYSRVRVVSDFYA